MVVRLAFNSISDYNDDPLALLLLITVILP
jgi:hypothetical protein